MRVMRRSSLNQPTVTNFAATDTPCLFYSRRVEFRAVMCLFDGCFCSERILLAMGDRQAFATRRKSKDLAGTFDMGISLDLWLLIHDNFRFLARPLQKVTRHAGALRGIIWLWQHILHCDKRSTNRGEVLGILRLCSSCSPHSQQTPKRLQIDTLLLYL